MRIRFQIKSKKIMFQKFNPAYIPVSTFLGNDGDTKTNNICAVQSKNFQFLM